MIAACLAFLAVPAYVVAETSDLRLKILPMQCVFEVVNDGSNTLRYLTPEDCGQLVTDPGPGQQPTESNNTPITGITPFFSPIRPSEPNIAPTDIYLNDFAAFMSAAGITLDLSLGQTVYFSIASRGTVETHSITVKEIGADYVVLTIASAPFDTTLHVGDKQQYDIIGNGQDDIEITLNSVGDNTANLTFRQLAQPANPAITATTEESQDKPAMWPYIVSTIIAVGVSASLLIRKYKHAFKPKI